MTKWTGKVRKCELCGKSFGEYFYDARLPLQGCWALLCGRCFSLNGCKLGVGQGQKYRTSDREKVEG